MCVIAYKPRESRLPSDRIVEMMWNANPHGAGVMWRSPKTGRIHYEKGFMKLKPFVRWLEERRAWLEDLEVALHFRITTHGGTCEGNCHPFVCDESYDSHALRGSAERILMHNGVLDIVPRRKDISDSAELALRLGTLGDPMSAMAVLNEQLLGNRIIVMDGDGTHFFGDRWKESSDPDGGGCLFSNLNWEPSAYVSRGGAVRGFGDFGGGDECGTWNGGLSASRFREDVYFDRGDGVFRERITGIEVGFHEVDPDGLDDDDYDSWLRMYDEMRDRVKREYGVDDETLDEMERDADEIGVPLEEYAADVADSYGFSAEEVAEQAS